MSALLEIRGLVKKFPIQTKSGPLTSTTSYVRAVDGVDLTLQAGETLGLVGESGCGKSTLGRCILRLIEPSGGTVTFDGGDFLGLRSGDLRRARRDIQIVFQDPLASLNPRMNVGAIVAEPLRLHRIVPRREVEAEVERLLDEVGLPASAVSRYPHEFSGGQRQRIGIARALAMRPKLIVADEPVSALDVSIRAQILNLFREVQAKSGVALIFIAHDLGAVRQVSDRIAVMYLGKIVETGPSETIFENPRHPYTRALLASIPTVDASAQSTSTRLAGDVPSPIDIPTGCRFRTRCPLSQEICAAKVPELTQFEGGEIGHLSACHFAAALD